MSTGEHCVVKKSEIDIMQSRIISIIHLEKTQFIVGIPKNHKKSLLKQSSWRRNQLETKIKSTNIISNQKLRVKTEVSCC